MSGIHRYSTASTTHVFIDGIHIDAAHRVDIKVANPIVPIYGYNDITYSRTIRGQQLIQGVLIINFIIPNYISVIMEKARAIKASDPIKKFLLDLFRNETSEVTSKRVIERALSSTEEEAEEIKRQMIELTKYGFTYNDIKTFTLPEDIKYAATMDIYYHDPQSAKWFIRLKDVEFMDITQTIASAGAAGSSDPLYESYEFIAKKRELVVSEANRHPEKLK